MMLSMLSMYEQSRNDLCFLCSNAITEIKSYPNVCEHLFHYNCLRNYVDNRIEKSESIICPICSKIFYQIANKHKKSKEILYQNVILSNDETQCCICFSKYKWPVASTDTCTHTFCQECIKKWCTFKHECPMDRMPIKLLLISDFPGGHITKKIEPPAIEQDLNGDGDNDEILNTTCEICNLGNDDEQLLLCDNCNRGYHMYCLAIPLNEVPEGDWFCDECSTDMGRNNQRMPRGIRGLHRVIDDLQVRYESANQDHSIRRQRTTNRRNPSRIIRDVVHDDSDWDDDVVVQRLRQRTGTRTAQDGIRRSLRNRRISTDDEVQPASVRNNIITSRQEEISVRESNDELSRNRRRVIEESEEEEVATQEVEQVQPHVNSESENDYLQNIGIRTRNRCRNEGQVNSPVREVETITTGRNRQGSLSSEPESEIEPLKKKPRLIDSSSSSEESSIESVATLQVTTRKRARNQMDVSELDDDDDDDDDCPLPRRAKKTARIICDSSDSDSENAAVVDNSEEIDESAESDSSESLEEDDSESSMKEQEDSVDTNEDLSSHNIDDTNRKRHISTSSSLSTIPCRLSKRSNSVARQTIKQQTKQKVRQCTQVEDIFSDSSIFDNTDSDYDPSLDLTVRQPSTSQRASTSKKVKKRKTRRTKKTTRKTGKRKSKRKSTSRKRKSSSNKRKSSSKRKSSKTNTTILAENSPIKKLSLFGRERHLPIVSDDELNIKRLPVATVPEVNTRTKQSNNSILSEITEAQTNFRQISLATIIRLPDGTLVHKSHVTEHRDSSENKDPNNQMRNVPSTSSSILVGNDTPSTRSVPQNEQLPSTGHKEIKRNDQQLSRRKCNIEQFTEAVPANFPQQSFVCPETNEQVVQPVISLQTNRNKPHHNNNPSLNINRPSDSIITSAVSTNNNTTDSSHKEALQNYKKMVIKFLTKFVVKFKLTKEEVGSLADRISEKVMQRNNQKKTPGESSIQDFTNKYLKFYMKKKK